MPLAFTSHRQGHTIWDIKSLRAHAPVHRGSDPEPGKGLNMFANERLQRHWQSFLTPTLLFRGKADTEFPSLQNLKFHLYTLTAKHGSRCPDTSRTNAIIITIAIIIHLFILVKAPPQIFSFRLNFHYQCSPICLIYTIHLAARRKIHDEIVNCKFRPGGIGMQSQLLRIKMPDPAWATEQNSKASTSELKKKKKT